MLRFISLLFLTLVFAACELSPSSNLSSPAQASFEIPSISRAIKLPKPGKHSQAEVAAAKIYAENAQTFIANLVSQFSSSINMAVATGTLTEAQKKAILKRINKQQNALNKALNKFIKKASVSALSNDLSSLNSVKVEPAVVLRFKSPFGPPFRIVPGAKKKARLAFLRIIVGQMDSFSGFGIAFIQSLTQQFEAVFPASQLALVEKLDKALVKAFQKDVNALKNLAKIINLRRFKAKVNKKKLKPENIAGDYTGTCTNMANGHVDNVSASVEYNADTGELKLSFTRQDDIFGPGAMEMFTSAFGKKGVSFSQLLALFGNVKVKILKNGYIEGSISAEPAATIGKVTFQGVSKVKDGSVTIDGRVALPDFSEGGQTHIIMELTKSS